MLNEQPTRRDHSPTAYLPSEAGDLTAGGADPHGDPTQPAYHRTALFNLKFSQNLGDGIIAECLERALTASMPGLAPVSIDLGGRERFVQHAPLLNRHRLLSLIERLPQAIRARIMPLALNLLVRSRYVPRWRKHLKGCQSAVIGGGALLTDTDQNFPIKLQNALTLCSQQGIPVAISHVGATSGWSAEGRKRVYEALQATRVIGLTVRDPLSIDNWQATFGNLGLAPPHVALDPGLLSAETYGSDEAARQLNDQPRVGVCITHPMVLRLHGEGFHDSTLLSAWFRELLRRLHAAGNRVALFSNGSVEDHAFIQTVLDGHELREAIEVAPAFRTPGELARYISTLNCVVAHRLHACIAAYSYRVPSIGLTWDKKLDSFFGIKQRGDYVVDWRETSPGSVAALTARALADPPSADVHARLLAECRAGIRELAAKLVGKEVTA
jgi:polysaccharide pyruvyl transferase WcaK-like protein